MKLELDDDLKAELEYLVETLNKEKKFEGDVKELIHYVLYSIADGSRRPGSWERSLLLPLGLEPDDVEFHNYRGKYGKQEE